MIFEIICCVLISGLILLLISELSDSHIKSLGQKLPGPKRLPIFGNFLFFSMPRNGAGMLEMRKKLIDEFGHTSRFWIGNELYVVISDPEDVEVILNKTTDLSKDKLYKFFKPWLGDGLLISGGKKWFGRRKAITPAFHFKILEEFVSIFNRNGAILSDMLKEQSGKSNFDVQPYISRFALDVICETAMGVRVDAQKNLASPYVSSVKGLMKLLFNRMRNPIWWNDFLYGIFGLKSKESSFVNTIHNFSNKVIREKRKDKIDVTEENEALTGSKNKIAFLELLLHLSKKPETIFKTDEDIREEVDTFMFEGHDTTTSALSSILHVLSKYQDVQEKVLNEVQQVMAGKDCMNPSYQDLQEMKYLECVIKETIRLYPPVPAIARDLNEDIQLPSGFIAPKGAIALISLFFLHRNNKYFTNPEVFEPDNFSPEKSTGRHPYAYIPFSAGQRNCIGQKFAMLEMKSTLVKLISSFHIKYAGKDWEIIPNPTLTLQSVNGFHIQLVERQ